MEEVPVSSLQTAIRILELLVERGNCGVTEIADELDKPKSTVHDHLVTLTELRYLVKEDETYRLGMKSLLYGDMARKNMQLYSVGRPEMERMAAETSEHASLTIEEHGEAILIATAKGDKAIPVEVFEGTRTAIHTTGPGKAMLAHLPPERIREIIDMWGLPRRTENTITDEAELLEELAWIREQKYALDDEERLTGMRSVGVPLVDRNEQLRGALTVYGPTNRLDDQMFEEELPRRLLNAGNVIEILLNYEPER